MKVRRNDTAINELAANYPAAWVFLSGDRRFFDEDLDFFSHLDVQGMRPDLHCGFYCDDISIERVKELWETEYRKKAERAGIKPMAFYFFDRHKTVRQAFQAWYFHGVKNKADRRARYKTLNNGGKN